MGRVHLHEFSCSPPLLYDLRVPPPFLPHHEHFEDDVLCQKDPSLLALAPYSFLNRRKQRVIELGTSPNLKMRAFQSSFTFSNPLQKKSLTRRKEHTSSSPPIVGSSTQHRRLSMDKLFHHGKEKRRSWSERPSSPGSSSSKSPKGSPKLGPTKHVKRIQLEIDMESPPLVSYGPPNASTGALLSGKLNIIVNDTEAQLTRLDMVLDGYTLTRKPVAKDCPDCQSRKYEIFKWQFLTEPHTYPNGTTSLPFSYLIPGHFPATSHSKLGSIEYHLMVAGHTPTTAPPLLHTRQLVLQRAIPTTQMDRNSLRVFPPTNVTTNITSPPVIHPIGNFNVQVRISGIYEEMPDFLRRWRLRKVIWHLDEHAQIISPACPKHTHKLGSNATEGKGIQHTDVRHLSNDELTDGWKTDFDAAGGGMTEFEFSAGLKPSSMPVCDVDSQNGFVVSHNMVLELVVTEEYSISKKARNFVPTGGAKVLKMSVAMKVSERSGMGISWDEEQPPMYEDVPGSPPVYARIAEFEGELPAVEEEGEGRLENLER